MKKYSDMDGMVKTCLLYIRKDMQTAKAWGLKEGDLFKCEPYLQIKMVNGSHAMWVPSINDILAEDWDYVH